MMTYFYYECKRIIKSRKFVIALVFVLLVYVFTIVEIKEDEQKSIEGNQIFEALNTNAFAKEVDTDQSDEVTYIDPQSMELQSLFSELGVMDEKGFKENLTQDEAILVAYYENLQTNNEALLKNNKLTEQERIDLYFEQAVFTTLFEYNKISPLSGIDYSKQIAFVNRVADEYGLKDVRKALHSFKKEIRSVASQVGFTSDQFYRSQFQLRYAYEIYSNHIPELNPYSINSATVLYQLTSNVLPVAIPAMVLLMFFNLFDKDKKQGTLKTILIQPRRKTLSFDGKSIAGLWSSFLLVCIPMVLISGVLLFSDQANYNNYPMIIREREAMVVNPISNTSDVLEDLYYSGEVDSKTLHYGLSEYSPERYDLWDGTPTLNSDLVPLWQFNLLLFAAVICYLAFIYMLFTFINTVCNNRILACLLFVAIVVGGQYVTPLDTMYAGNVYNPFSYSNPIQNLQGTSTFGWPYIYMVLPIYTVVLYVAGKVAYRFKRFY
ncbi:hypothetical protein A4S06_00225 [Erysipelotrichaceae bacterium MTC7]|nr:hypothetical protein A4S06_00225 [Erysipelotrichaceae bacterium MTC7]